jgi:nitrile hydratase accessory protein
MTGPNGIARGDPHRKELAGSSGDFVEAQKFGQPWHAQVFGLAMGLAQANVFTWETWVARFSAEIHKNPQRPDEANEDAYYRQWVDTLVSLLLSRGLLTVENLKETTSDWRRSYLATPHGKPIVFRRDLPAIETNAHDDHHAHHHHGKADICAKVRPVHVSLASRK